MDRTIQTDVLVIGGGQAGFFAAMKAQEQGVKVTMVDKGYAGKSGQSQNITCMIYFDPVKNDLAKWMAEGPLADEYLENRDWVEVVYRESKDRWDDMAKWGMKSWRYDKNGNAYLAPINGSDDERCPGEPEEDVITNYLIHNRYHWRLRSLFQNNGGTIVDRVMVTDLIQQDGHIAGAIGFSPDDDDTYIFQRFLRQCGPDQPQRNPRTAASEPIQLLAMHRRWPIGWAVPLPVRSGRISMALAAISRPTPGPEMTAIPITTRMTKPVRPLPIIFLCTILKGRRLT